MTQPTDPPELTDREIERWKSRLLRMDRLPMARLYRFAPVGHPVFRRDMTLNTIFNQRFKQLGGMSSEVSQQIGW